MARLTTLFERVRQLRCDDLQLADTRTGGNPNEWDTTARRNSVASTAGAFGALPQRDVTRACAHSGCLHSTSTAREVRGSGKGSTPSQSTRPSLGSR